jgi:hypothetical protein
MQACLLGLSMFVAFFSFGSKGSVRCIIRLMKWSSIRILTKTTHFSDFLLKATVPPHTAATHPIKR